MGSLSFDEQKIRLDNYISVLQMKKFYGKVTLDIQGGNILRIVKQESTRLEDVDGESSEEAQAIGREDQVQTTEAKQTS